MKTMITALALCAIASAAFADVPADFIEYKTSSPEAQKNLDLLRALYYENYDRTTPQATLWDDWLSKSGLWDGYTGSDNHRKAWKECLSQRKVNPETGYVHTDQHASIAHPEGWPFPFWNQGVGGKGKGWHFSFKNTVGKPWRQTNINKPEEWNFIGCEAGELNEDGLPVTLTAPDAALEPPIGALETMQAPFMQTRYIAEKDYENLKPYIEWKTDKNGSYDENNRVYIDAPASWMRYAVADMTKNPNWTGTVYDVRLRMGNETTGQKIVLQAFFTTYDTRHNVNSQAYIRGCCHYFFWTGDVDFLKTTIDKIRLAHKQLLVEHHAEKENIIHTTWVGHDPKPGIVRENGKRVMRPGVGIGSNYWDLIPFGAKDCYATVLYYDMLNHFARLEKAIENHPEWGIEKGEYTSADLLKKAAKVKDVGNKLFWNEENGRFNHSIDEDGLTYDYGYTFVNTEAVYTGFATDEHAREIMSWIDGTRVVKGDTSIGDDIYHWKFGPRSTTKRNTDYYCWVWNDAGSIPWGGQVQDGGAVLGFSYYDVMARMRVNGVDDSWERLCGITDWYKDVLAEGGYRKYYENHDGTLQGGGTAGGLGCDFEFFETALVPQVVTEGYLGLRADADSLIINPNLPAALPDLSVSKIKWHNTVMTVKATGKKRIEAVFEGKPGADTAFTLPEGDWMYTVCDAKGKLIGFGHINGNYKLSAPNAGSIRFDLCDL